MGLVLAMSVATSAEAREEPRGYGDVLEYISRSWDVLTRSQSSCEVVVDPKLGDRSVLYLPMNLPEPASVQALRQKCPQVQVQRLPQVITGPGQVDVRKLQAQGLLYLEHPYVVPGGRFNEMYGWDSYFILRGLLRDGRSELAQGMVRNFLFEVQHYGSVLNANRTYYLTRSQPPFLSSMVMAVYDEGKLGEAERRAWLEEALPYMVRDYEMWTRGAHLAGDTGLSRYFDHGEGPVPEIADDNRHYRDTVWYFMQHPEEGKPYMKEVPVGTKADSPVNPVFTTQVCEQTPGTIAVECTSQQAHTLTEDFYKGDRAMRESGYDVSFRFGPYGAGTHHYAAVDLNSLLYKTEKDLERISTQLGRTADASRWRERAAQRKERMNRYMWDAKRGMYFDYDFTTGQRSTYEYATTFYPLWAEQASPEQARALLSNLSRFEQPCGLAMSQRKTGAQWDFPFGWAPAHLLSIEGMRHYGYDKEADRLSRKYLDLVAGDFRRTSKLPGAKTGVILEKYDVVACTSEVDVTKGYRANVVGFGWTNGVFLELLHGLQQEPGHHEKRQARPPARERRPSPSRGP
ncbi:trehalase family glycosidase [Archangium lipolyticum]|uniref:trehalase family glycosidase n=1 Tax=Archangium lipolyticum TaxID=2970465 RepID=UPI002149E5BB|nr:trehalase family glycosidase [Archangium lipolyticum]